jgi:hypothetical protein
MFIDVLFDLPRGSRLRGVWRRAEPHGVNHLFFTMLHLLENQDVHIESDVVCQYAGIPLAGVHGRDAAGRDWICLASGGGNPLDAIVDINPLAQVRTEFIDAEDAQMYMDRSIDETLNLPAFARITMLELMGLDVEQAISLTLAECAFPDVDHHCYEDGWNDTCTAWLSGELWTLLGRAP